LANIAVLSNDRFAPEAVLQAFGYGRPDHNVSDGFEAPEAIRPTGLGIKAQFEIVNHERQLA